MLLFPLLGLQKIAFGALSDHFSYLFRVEKRARFSELFRTGSRAEKEPSGAPFRPFWRLGTRPVPEAGEADLPYKTKCISTIPGSEGSPRPSGWGAGTLRRQSSAPDSLLASPDAAREAPRERLGPSGGAPVRDHEKSTKSAAEMAPKKRVGR